jgi:hypothetical protein
MTARVSNLQTGPMHDGQEARAAYKCVLQTAAPNAGQQCEGSAELPAARRFTETLSRQGYSHETADLRQLSRLAAADVPDWPRNDDALQ